MLLATRLLEALAGWLGTVIIARQLSESDFGGISLIFGLLGIIGLALDLQVTRVALRDVLDAGDDAGPVVGSYVLFRTALGAVSYLLAVGIVLIGDYPTDVVIGVAIAALGFLFVGPNIGLALWFRARRWMRPTAIGTAIAAMVQFSLVVTLAAVGSRNLVLFASAITTAEFVAFTMRIWFTHRYGLRVHLGFTTRRWWAWFKESLPLAIGFSLVTVYAKVDLVLLSQLDSLRSVGQYAIGYKFADLVGYVPFALMTPVMTLMVEAWPGRSRVMRAYFRQSLVLLALAGVAASVGFALIADHVVTLLYGERYAPSIGAARLLVAGAAVQFFSYLCFVTLASIGRSKPYAIAGMVGLIVNLGLNFVLIPEYSFDGAAVATVLTEVGVLAVLLTALVRSTEIVDIPWGAILRALVAGVAMSGIYFAADALVPWYLAALLAGAVFVGVIHVLGADGPGGVPALLRGARFSDADAIDPTDFG